MAHSVRGYTPKQSSPTQAGSNWASQQTYEYMLCVCVWMHIQVYFVEFAAQLIQKYLIKIKTNWILIVSHAIARANGYKINARQHTRTRAYIFTQMSNACVGVYVYVPVLPVLNT